MLLVHQGHGWPGAAQATLEGAALLAGRGHHVRIGANAGSQLAARAQAAGIELHEESASVRFHPEVILEDLVLPAPSGLWDESARATALECAAFAQALARNSVRRTLFVDRDDTLVRDVPYNGDPQAVVLEPFAGCALASVRAAGWKIFVVSNQSGIARGRLREDQVRAVHARVQELLEADGARIDDFYFCPHHPDVGGPCDCRKPEPGMLLRAAREHGVELERSVMIGDTPHDLEAGRRAGAATCAYVPAHRAAAPSDAYRNWLVLVRDLLRTAWLD